MCSHFHQINIYVRDVSNLRTCFWVSSKSKCLFAMLYFQQSKLFHWLPSFLFVFVLFIGTMYLFFISSLIHACCVNFDMNDYFWFFPLCSMWLFSKDRVFKGIPILLHCKCLQGFTGTLRSVVISNLWGLHVYPQCL